MNSNPNECVHLNVEVVIKIHHAAIAQFGGTMGLRSRDLLESAVAAPQAAFGGQSVFANVIEIAAAYLFYLYSNHPFLDGNKRVALGSCLIFLKLNGYKPTEDSKKWETLTLGVAAGAISRGEAAGILTELCALQT